MTLSCGPLRFVDLDTGREVGTVLTETDTFDLTNESPDGRWLFVSAFAGSAYRPVLIPSLGGCPSASRLLFHPHSGS